MIYTNPALAKSCIRFALKHSLENGEIKRQDIDYGYCDPGVYMESDAQIYMFMAVGEYLRLTGDYGLLDEEVSYYPVEHGKKDTVLPALIAGLRQYLAQTVVGQLVSEFIEALQWYWDTVYEAFMTDMEGRISGLLAWALDLCGQSGIYSE